MAQIEFDVVANDKATSAINSIAVAVGNILADLASQATAAIVDFTKESHQRGKQPKRNAK